MLKIERPQLSIIIPVFNEVKTVEQVVRKIQALPVSKEIIVIDDFSTDGSRELLKKLQPELRLKLILHATNKGKGAGVIAGAAYAKGRFIIVEDADSELDPADILEMLQMIEKDPSIDMIIGNRILKDTKGVNPATHSAQFVTRILLALLYGRSIKDPLCAYKFCKLEKFKSLGITSQRFGLEIEWLVKAIKKGWKIAEKDISYVPRGKKEGKKIRFSDGLDIVAHLIKLRFSA